MSCKHKTIIFILLSVFILTAHSIIGHDDERTIKSCDKHYCKMVEIHMANPAYGWPDYNNNYDIICK